MLDREVLLALEDVHGLLDIVIAERDGTDGLREAHGLIERAHVDVAARGVADGATHVDLVVEACEELAGIGLGATCAHETGAAGCAAGDGQELGARLAIGRGGSAAFSSVTASPRG